MRFETCKSNNLETLLSNSFSQFGGEVRSVSWLAGWIRTRFVERGQHANGRPRERGCKTNDNCFLLIDELQSGPCALTRLAVSLHAYASNSKAQRRLEGNEPGPCVRVVSVFTSAKTLRFGPVLRFNYGIRATSPPPDVRPESVMSATLPVSVLISDRMDRKEERKGLPSGSVRRSFFGRRAALCII